MKLLIEFEKIALIVTFDEFCNNFLEFMHLLASEIGVSHRHLKIKFGDGMEIDENYQWPVFRTRYFINEKISARYDNIDISDHLSTILGNLKTNINNIFQTCFNEYSQSNLTMIQDSSNFSKGNIELIYQTKIMFESKIDLRFSVICIVRNEKVFFHINDYKPLGLEYLSILMVSNKSLPLEIPDFMDMFVSKFKRYASDIFHYRKSAFLSLPYKIRCMIIKHLTSLEDFRSLCFTCNILSSCLYDDYIIKLVYFNKFRRMPPSNSTPREELKKAIMKTPESTRHDHFENPIPPIQRSFFPDSPMFYVGHDFRPPYQFPGVIGGPRDMYPNVNYFFDPTRFNRDIPDPYQNDPYQAWDRGNRFMRFPPSGGFRSPFDP